MIYKLNIVNTESVVKTHIHSILGINLPAEILRMKDKDAIELYKKALNDGEEKVYNIRLMIVGHFGVGKTALTKRFLNKKFDITKRVSTEGIDLHIGKMTINLKNGEWLEHTTGTNLILWFWFINFSN